MKRTIAIPAAAALALTLAACGTGETGSGGETTNLRIGSNWTAAHPMAQVIDEVFKPSVEENSNGSLSVEVFHGGTLGNEADLWDSVRNGTIEMVIVGTPMNQEFSTMLISDWPFLYRDLDHAKAVWTGEIAEEINEQFHEAFPSTYMLAWGPNSARTFTSREPLTSIDDFAGQQFRMPGNPIHIGLAEGLGASAQVIPLGELFTSLETGVVDGQDNGMVTVISERLYEVQDYVYETNHIIATLELIVNASFMDGLTEEEQQIIRDAALEASAEAWDRYIESVDADREYLEEQGLTVTQLTDADREAMIDRLQPLMDRLYSENEWAEALTARIGDVN